MKKADSDDTLCKMGSTVVMTALFSSFVQAANVGDSRAYHITPDGKITQISYDHSFVMEQVRNGLITKEEAARHPKKNVLTMSLTGQRDTVDPYTAQVPWNEGDHVLICSDGLWGSVSESQISSIVTSLEPQQAADKLIQMANMNQGPDNISVMIARNGRKKPGRNDNDDKDPVTDDMIALTTPSDPAGRLKKVIIIVLSVLAVLGLVFLLLHRGILPPV